MKKTNIVNIPQVKLIIHYIQHFQNMTMDIQIINNIFKKVSQLLRKDTLNN
jgi:hypothetical protein